MGFHQNNKSIEVEKKKNINLKYKEIGFEYTFVYIYTRDLSVDVMQSNNGEVEFIKI